MLPQSNHQGKTQSRTSVRLLLQLVPVCFAAAAALVYTAADELRFVG